MKDNKTAEKQTTAALSAKQVWENKVFELGRELTSYYQREEADEVYDDIMLALAKAEYSGPHLEGIIGFLVFQHRLTNTLYREPKMGIAKA